MTIKFIAGTHTKTSQSIFLLRTSHSFVWVERMVVLLLTMARCHAGQQSMMDMAVLLLQPTFRLHLLSGKWWLATGERPVASVQMTSSTAGRFCWEVAHCSQNDGICLRPSMLLFILICRGSPGNPDENLVLPTIDASQTYKFVSMSADFVCAIQTYGILDCYPMASHPSGGTFSSAASTPPSISGGWSYVNAGNGCGIGAAQGQIFCWSNTTYGTPPASPPRWRSIGGGCAISESYSLQCYYDGMTYINQETQGSEWSQSANAKQAMCALSRPASPPPPFPSSPPPIFSQPQSPYSSPPAPNLLPMLAPIEPFTSTGTPAVATAHTTQGNAAPAPAW